MKFLSFAILATSLCLSIVSAINPGVKLFATPAAINDFSVNFISGLISQLGSIKISDTHVADFKLTNIIIQNLCISGQDVKVALDQGRVSFKTHSFGFELNYYLEGKILRFIPVHFNGGGSSSNSELDLEFSFGRSGDSTQISLDKLQIKVKNLQLHFPKDGLGNAATDIANLIRDPLQEAISALISNAMKGVIQNGLNSAFGKIPTALAIPHTPLSMSIRSTQAPSITPNYLASFINGALFNTKDGFSMPNLEPPTPLPDCDYSSSVQALVSEYAFNSGFLALWKSGAMEMNVTKSMLPKQDASKYNVGLLKALFPNVTKHFSNETWEIIVNVKALKAPFVRISPNNVYIEGDLGLTFYVISDNQKVSKAASIESNLTLHANALIEQWVFKPHILESSFGNFSLLSSEIGSFDSKKAHTEINKLLNSSIVDFNTEKITFPLPKFEAVDLSSLYIVIQNQYIRVKASPKYTTTDLKKLLPFDLF